MSAPAYQYANSPTAIQAEAGEGLFTAWQLAADIPQVRRQLMSRHNYTKNFYHVLRELGLGGPLIGPSFAHWEEDWIINNFVVGSIITPSTGAGTNVTFQLDTSSMYSTTLPGSVAANFSYLAEMDEITLYDDTKAQVIKNGVDMTHNPFYITVRPSDPTNDLSGKIVASNRYWISSNGFGEGTFGAKPKMPRTYRWSNNTQIIKSNFAETGTSATNKLPFKNVEGMEGSLLILGGDATERMQFDRVSKALLFGKQGTNQTVTSDALGYTVPIKFTQGLDDYVVTYGNQLPYPIGSFDITDFDALGEVFNREQVGTKNILMPMGFNLQQQISNTLKSYMDYTCFEYAVSNWPFQSNIMDMANVIGSPKGFFLWLDFEGLTKNGYHFLMKHQKELDEIQAAGTTGYKWPNVGYALPVTSYKNSEYNDAWSPSIGYRYKALNGYNREMQTTWTGGAPVKARATNSLDAYQMDILSEIGGEWALGNQMVKILPQ